MLSLLKYLLFALSAGLAISAQWLFKFTRDDPYHPRGLALTRWGRVGFPIALLTFALGLGLEIFESSEASREAEENRQSIANLQQELRNQTAEVKKQTAYNQEILEHVKRMAELIPRDRLAELQADPGGTIDRCDFNGDGLIDSTDVQRMVDVSLGKEECSSRFDINQDGACNVADVQRVINASLGLAPCAP